MIFDYIKFDKYLEKGCLSIENAFTSISFWLCIFLFFTTGGNLLLAQNSEQTSSRSCAYESRGFDLLNNLKESETGHSSEKSESSYIPIVFHIVQTSKSPYISDKQITDQLQRINEDFSGTNEDMVNIPLEFNQFISKEPIRFCLASEDPSGNSTNGIIRLWSEVPAIGVDSFLFNGDQGGSYAWEPTRYLNIWVASFGENNGLAGFASSPGALIPEREQGVVVKPSVFAGGSNYRFSKGRTVVHEIGHYLGLEHPWGDGGCNSDDFVIDTPSQAGESNGCPSHPQISCGSDDMFMNFMDYVDDDCMLFFTKGQKARMLSVIEEYRPDLMQPCDVCHENVADRDNENLDFLLYPNPTSRNQIKIRFTSVSQTTTRVKLVEVFDALGKRVYKKETFLYGGIELNLNLNLASGTYFVSIGGKTSRLVIIDR